MKMMIIPKALRVCACEAESGVWQEFVLSDKSEMMITVCAGDQGMRVCIICMCVLSLIHISEPTRPP